MADVTTRYGDDIKALYDREWAARHPDIPIPAEGPSRGIGQTAMGRIGDLAKQVTEAAHVLAEARDQYQKAAVHRQKSEQSFAAVSEALSRSIQEHREGTPENMPYQP